MKQQIFQYLFSKRLNIINQRIFSLYGKFYQLERPIFIIGLNRSGTSIFTKLFSLSSETVNWSEANELWDPIGYPFEKNQVNRPFWPIDPQGYTNAVLASLSPVYLQAIPGICAMYCNTFKQTSFSHPVRFINKSPMNTLRIDWLNSLFPDAYFISLVRDPRAVVRSWAEKIM